MAKPNSDVFYAEWVKLARRWMALRHEWENSDERRADVRLEMEALQRDMAGLEDNMKAADRAS